MQNLKPAKSFKLTGLILFFFPLVFLVNSCKKDHKDADLLNASTGSSFTTGLYNQLIAYDKEHPIMDSIALAGTIDWNKAIARISSNISMPVNFDFPIVNNNNECTQTLEFSFTNEKKLVEIKIRKSQITAADTSFENGNPRTENNRTLDILYHLSHQGLKVSSAITGYGKQKEAYISKTNQEQAPLRLETAKLQTQAAKRISGINKISAYANNCGSLVEFDFILEYSLHQSDGPQDYNLFASITYAYSQIFWRWLAPVATLIAKSTVNNKNT